ncbi:head-tail connector protein [Cellulophaga phage phi10:1]|uniref:Head-tail connector protein n=1 Tax=Cellulophaga phage phi10:1 TaxID=1327981 RepID=R9ZZ82_9CAUD|nr:head-tail connector protein [Cellulophaga phage phi10:1]AGO48421.1 head-tail connector protein [Cellulophaga phage phi10:1]
MTHLEVISLDDAKDYLGVDDTSRDTEINRMIKSAISYVEKHTQHHLVEKTKTYGTQTGCIRVYDYPIVSTDNTTHSVDVKNGYSVYNNYSVNSIDLVLGYNTLDDVPSELVEAAYILIKFFFYEQDKMEEKGRVPFVVEQILESYKRFLI